MESASESNLVILTNKIRVKIFCNIYWRIILILSTPIILIPINFIGESNAYTCLYVFLLTAVYWVADVAHPAVIAMVPVALLTLLGAFKENLVVQLAIRCCLLNCLGMMMIIVAIEKSLLHRRVALKLLLIFGCSHYRLSFLLFFITMFMSMWVSSTVACGLMMPLVKAILSELERMGILEVYQTIGKTRQRSSRHQSNSPRPTDFTVFYFLGIAYSSSIGSMGTMIGSETNNILRVYCDVLNPSSPQIEFPQFMLLNLPGVIVIELLVYVWMNAYFLGMFRGQSEIALEIGLSEEEAQYIKTLLQIEYGKLRKLTYLEVVAGAVTITVVTLQLVVTAVLFNKDVAFTIDDDYYSHFNVSSTPLLVAILLFLIPSDLNFTKFFMKNLNEPLPSTTSKAILSWIVVWNKIDWSVLFIISGSSSLFESFKSTGLSEEVGAFLRMFQNWPSLILTLIIIVFFKILSEFANSTSIMYAMMPTVIELTKGSHDHPFILMLAATLASSTPFHLVVGSPVNAMVTAYVHIPPWKMMSAGLGPSLITVTITWFTVTLWSKAVWNEVQPIDTTLLLRNF